MRKIQIILIISFLITGCKQDNFYTEYQIDDLWRIPLKKPYELRNVAGANAENFYNDNWHLSFKNKVEANSLLIGGVNVTMINIDHNVIYGFGTKNPGYHFVINCISGEEKIFQDTSLWQQSLRMLGVDYKKTYDPFDIFEKFKNKNSLPWRGTKSDN